MFLRLKQRIRHLLDDYLDTYVDEILQQKGIPSKEEWEHRLSQIKEREEWLKTAYKQYDSEKKKEPPPTVFIEGELCSSCARPHFQAGLCLLHFHQRYTQLITKGDI